MSDLEKIISELEGHIPVQDVLNTAVSKASVGWHIEHSLITISLILSAVKASNPKDYKWEFNFRRTLVYAINKIPRGRAQAPGVVQPKPGTNIDTLKKQLRFANGGVQAISLLDKNNFFVHPYFGKLNVKQTIKFLKIHSRHHIHIINDILKAQN